jgi:hypothetical protein
MPSRGCPLAGVWARAVGGLLSDKQPFLALFAKMVDFSLQGFAFFKACMVGYRLWERSKGDVQSPDILAAHGT